MPERRRRSTACSDGEAVKAAAAQIGRVDVLFNCAGVVHNGTVLEMPESDLEFAFDLNIWAQVRMIRAFLPAMLEHGDGCIINMSTVASSVTAVPNRAAYTISKAAVIVSTSTVALIVPCGKPSSFCAITNTSFHRRASRWLSILGR